MQAVAESLFGAVLHQLRVPGAPLLTGMGPVKLDMNTVQALYNSAEYYPTIMGITEMAKWMDIPNWGYAGTSDSQCVDINAGIDITELTLISMQAGSNLNHDIGYLDFGLTGAGELVVIEDEVISMNRRVLEGIEVTDETLGLDVIAGGRPRRRLPARPPHQEVRARPAVEAHAPQPRHAEELGGRRLQDGHREGARQAARHHGQPHARAAQRPSRSRSWTSWSTRTSRPASKDSRQGTTKGRRPASRRPFSPPSTPRRRLDRTSP